LFNIYIIFTIMTILKEQTDVLKRLGFKMRSRKRYSLLTPYNQFFSVELISNGFQVQIDGRRIYASDLCFNDVIKIVNILYPNEGR